MACVSLAPATGFAQCLDGHLPVDLGFGLEASWGHHLAAGWGCGSVASLGCGLALGFSLVVRLRFLSAVGVGFPGVLELRWPVRPVLATRCGSGFPTSRYPQSIGADQDGVSQGWWALPSGGNARGSLMPGNVQQGVVE